MPRPTPFRAVFGLGVGGFAVSKLSAQPEEEKDFSGAPLKRKIQRFHSLVDRGQDPGSLKSRADQIKALKSGETFDILIIGAGCTGSGAALDAVTRGLKTACIVSGRAHTQLYQSASMC